MPFVLNPDQVRTKVFFFLSHPDGEARILLRDGHLWKNIPVSELGQDEHGHYIIKMVSKKTDKEFYWYLKDCVYLQYQGSIPDGHGVRQIEANNWTPSNLVLKKLKKGELQPAQEVELEDE